MEKFPFKINHTIQHQGNKYYFELGGSDLTYFQDIIANKNLSSKKYSDNLSNTISLLYDAKQFRLNAGVKHQWIELGTNNLSLAGNPDLPSFQENRIGMVGDLQFRFSDMLQLHSALEFSRGKAFGNYLETTNQFFYQPVSGYFLKANFNYKSSAPGFNFILNSSPVLSKNYAFTNYQNENTLNIGGELGTKFFQTKLFAQYFRTDNFTYFDANSQPKQSNEALTTTQIGGESLFNYGPFYLHAKLVFQQNLTGKDFLPLPNFVGRANIYYQTRAFKDKAEIQTGFKIYYFNKFASREFSPLLNEYILPGNNSFSIGGQPIADAYFNFKVKRMFFFIEAQHFTTMLTSNKIYTAPHYPYYDFRFNLGIIWYLFS